MFKKLKILKAILRELIEILEKESDITLLELEEILDKYEVSLEDLKKFAGIKK